MDTMVWIPRGNYHMLKAILIDDEKLALNYLERLLKQTGHVAIVAKFVSAQEGIEKVKSEKIDVVFLDIEMPGMGGIKAAERILEIDSGIEIVFVTAYHEYAVEAFEINALDYIMKPVQKARLEKTLERIHNYRVKEEAGKSEGQSTRIRCFKRLELTGGAPASVAGRWRTSKAQELFAYMVHHRGKSVPKERIIETLWSEYKPERASAHLHTSIYYIRKMLSITGIDVPIRFLKDSYRIHLVGIYCDVDEFEGFIRREYRVTDENIGGHEQIVALYRDDYFAENEYHWAEGERVRLRNAFLALLYRMAHYYLKENKCSKATHCFHVMLEKNPFSEKACQELMMIYGHIKDRAAVVRLFETFSKRLKDELGIEPENSTKRLYHSLITGEG